ncbi:ABC transporter ATP-binding protein [Streptomyces tanashiensis]|uniref:ABC transporter ATP-binding protein n=2 Tax=Streptomyces tanashiensis TaxID=67367 RepID=A0ABY6QQS0_9ACTN|nr:ABC transporter ATP-binding protein [Streptomyces tanashiensis]UZX20153.1 ABC transporter ATP-binding protein [Streptomyces tanashiensis]GGY44854.1 ABC transporter ATP-binding protein [Streptomyces tanashiensis]
MTTPPLLEVRGLDVEFTTPDGGTLHAVRDVSFTLRRGETLAVVGESGSGKSTTALALLRMLPGTGRISGGTVRLDGEDLATAGEDRLRAVRGARIGMVFQDPMTALNPVLTVGRHLDEVLRAHGGTDKRARRARAVELLRLVGIPDPERRLDDHPHQFSGGQRQRVLIAMALAGEPDVLLADEPTTALDATVQDQILTLLGELTRTTGTALVLITHNMGVVARSCARVLVLYGGTVVEDGPTAEVLTRPRHPYTAGLLAAVPRLSAPSGTRLTGIPGTPPDLSLPLTGCAFAARCALAEDRCHTAAPPLADAGGTVRAACFPAAERAARAALAGPDEDTEPPAAPPAPARIDRPAPGRVVLTAESLSKTYGSRRRRFTALDGVSLTLAAGETLGIVGESGSGKSTLARVLAHAHPADGGRILLDGRDVTRPGRAELHAVRRRVQMVFQDPYASLNPRMTVGEIVAEPLRAFAIGAPGERADRVAELLRLVGLDPAAADRHPRSFSGGQRQRIGIARALAPEPDVLICDEPVSALDVSVQAQIVGLLTDLQRDLGLALVFIAHDLAVVRQVSHRIAVMHDGRIVETGGADELCEHPRDPYTRALLAAAPEPVPVRRVPEAVSA